VKLASIFHRRGSPGQFTRKFEEFARDEQNDLLNQAQLASDELPVIASRFSSRQWVLITTNRTIASDSGSQCVMRHVEIEEVSPPKLSHVPDKQQWRELTIHLNNGVRRVISLESGPPFMGIWNVLLSLSRFNHRST
jgi:hypothetical protein